MNAFIVRALNLPPQASSFARGIDWLHAFVFATSFLGSMSIMALAVFFIAKFHGSRPAARKRSGVASTSGEVMLIAFILSLFLLWWVLGFREYDEMRRVPEGAMVVNVTAKQWMWKFEHEDGATELDTLTVPAGVPVQLVMTSRDVIHSFYVPAFRLKEDVIPGRMVTAWFEAVEPGDYPLRCAELCGAGHAVMSARVHVVPPAAYDAALDVARPSSPAAKRGLAAAAHAGCLSCHSLDGEPRIGPSWLGLTGRFEKMVSGEELFVDDAYLTESMMDPSAHVVAGYADVMPRFQGALSPAEVGDIIELIHSLRGPP